MQSLTRGGQDLHAGCSLQNCAHNFDPVQQMFKVVHQEQQFLMLQVVKKLLLGRACLAAGFQLKTERFGEGRDDLVDGPEWGEGDEEDAIGELPSLTLI